MSARVRKWEGEKKGYGNGVIWGNMVWCVYTWIDGYDVCIHMDWIDVCSNDEYI